MFLVLWISFFRTYHHIISNLYTFQIILWRVPLLGILLKCRSDVVIKGIFEVGVIGIQAILDARPN
jgi:hypothetical protein